ncbi:hypothetical protein DBV15_12445, partial [Temnothorax longispinosus]
MSQIQKMIKWASSALDYVATSVMNLRKALHLLTTDSVIRCNRKSLKEPVMAWSTLIQNTERKGNEVLNVEELSSIVIGDINQGCNSREL